MKTTDKIALAVAAGAAVLLFRKPKTTDGIGAVDNEWGANEMYLQVMNTESLYNTYRNNAFRIMGSTYYKDAIKKIANWLKISIKHGRIYLQPGMGRGEKARMMAAEDLYNAFNHDWMREQVK